MAARLEIVIGNTLVEIPAANDRIATWLQNQGAPSSAVLFANLCVEEIASNCVKYGYADRSEHAIELAVEIDADRVRVEIRDDGREFNPLTAPEPDLSGPVEDRAIGGLGLRMVRRMASGADYRREGGVNRLTLWKSLS